MLTVCLAMRCAVRGEEICTPRGAGGEPRPFHRWFACATRPAASNARLDTPSCWPSSALLK